MFEIWLKQCFFFVQIGDRIHCGNRRKLWPPAFYHFPEMFTEAYYSSVCETGNYEVKGLPFLIPSITKTVFPSDLYFGSVYNYVPCEHGRKHQGKYSLTIPKNIICDFFQDFVNLKVSLLLKRMM